MVTVTVPSLMRDLTGGTDEVEGHGTTLAELLADLDARYPGFRARLTLEGDLDPALIVLVDDRPAPLRLRARLREDSRVRFMPALGGG